MANVRKLCPRKYQARYRDLDSREHARNFTRQTDADAWLSTIEAAKLEGAYVDPQAGRVRMGDGAVRWLESVRPSLKPKTAATYESLPRSRVLPAFGMRQLRSVQHSDVQAWVARMEGDGLSASRIRQAVVVLRMMLDAAERDRRIGRNAARGVRLPKLSQEEAHFLDPATVHRIAEAAPEPYSLVIRLMGQVGLRYGEAAALRRQSFDDLRGRLEIRESLAELPKRTIAGEERASLVFGSTKTHAACRVTLPPTLAVELRAHVAKDVAADPDALLFPAPGGKPLRYSNFRSRVWHQALQRVGVPATGVHVLRHSAAAAMIASGASAKAVQSILGHRSVAFTLTVYGHLFEDDLDDLARLDATIRERVADSVRTAEGVEVLRQPEGALQTGL